VLHEGDLLVDGPVRDVFRQEDILAQANLVPPDVVQFSNRLGATLLSPAELQRCLVRPRPTDDE